jgi:hypothetical protein
MYWCTPLFDPPTGSPKLCWLATTAKHANPAPSHDACRLILLKTATKQPILTKALQPTPLAIVELLPQTLSLISRSRLPTALHRSHVTGTGLAAACLVFWCRVPGTANWITFAWWRAAMSSPGRAGSALGDGKLVGQKQYLHWTCISWFEPIRAYFQLNWIHANCKLIQLIDIDYL